MVHFIRNAENRTIIECEVTSKDLSASVDILYYTEHYRSLYEKDISSAVLFMDKMCDISNIRSWWWDSEEDGGEWDSIDEFVKTKFREVAIIFELIYIQS